MKPAIAPVNAEDRRRASIIICARNEAANLRQNLPLILKQDYSGPDGNLLYNVVVVNDHSDDETMQVLRAFQSEYPHLLVIDRQGESAPPGKKNALMAAAGASDADLFLFTDADCAPTGPHWLALMVAPLQQGKELVAGYSGFYKKQGLLNAFIRWETMHSFLQYATYCLAGIPYMAVGRNMACTRAAFQRGSGSSIWQKLPSGDDDLLVRDAATGSNMAIVSHPSAFTVSEPSVTMKAYRAQKQRHLSTGKFYKPLPMVLLGVYSGSHAAVWLGFMILVGTHWYFWALMLMYFRCLLHWSCWLNTSSRVGERRLVALFPFADFAWMLYNFALSPFVFFKNKTTWK